MTCPTRADLAQARSGCTLATTQELHRELHRIDQLIAALRMVAPSDPEDFVDLSWLQERRRFLLSVLAWRDQQKRQKIVSLALWRCGGPAAAAIAARVA